MLTIPDPQMKKANFDVSHELDEFLMVEKPLTHSKRKQNPDLEKMKPELRQLEEQYVPSPHLLSVIFIGFHRFTLYDFSKTKRISYYPHNQPITNGIHQEESEPSEIIPSTTNTLIPTSTVLDRSRPTSPINEDDGLQYTHTHPPIPSMSEPVEVSESRQSRQRSSDDSSS